MMNMTVEQLHDLIDEAVADALAGVVHAHDHARIASRIGLKLEDALADVLVHDDDPDPTEPDVFEATYEPADEVR